MTHDAPPEGQPERFGGVVLTSGIEVTAPRTISAIWAAGKDASASTTAETH